MINVTRSSLPDMNEYIDEIKDLWDSHWLTNMGSKHKALQQALTDYLRVGDITLFTNGHLALEAIIEALELKGEIITTPFTFASTTHAIVRKGSKPVFCDIEPDHYTIDADKIESLITDKTVAILPIHVYGNVCDVEKIAKIANKYKLKVIYDGAHAFGVEYKNQGIGTYGDASMFSFHATKVFHTIEGGGITCSDQNLKHQLDNVKNYGINGLESVEYEGGNAKMNEFQAAMGLCNLRHIDEEIAKRKVVYQRYIDKLRGIEGIILPKAQPMVKPNYAYLPIIFDGYKDSRDTVYQRLRQNDINARKYFYPLTNSFACYKDKYNDNDTPIAKAIAAKVLTLPLYSDLELANVDKIADIIKN